MILFRYNLKKYFRTVSTWVFLVIALVIIDFLAFILTYKLNNNRLAAGSPLEISRTMILLVYTILPPFLIMIIALFASFKSVQLFRDEINEGSLLLVISKPISRKRILIQKWLSLISIFIIFITPILGSQTIILLNNIKFKSLDHLIWSGFLGELFVSIVFFCLFSSLALMISLRLGVKSVIGLAFACTFLVVISNSVQTFTYSSQFTLMDSRFEGMSNDQLSTIWNVDNDKKSTAPKFYIKTSDKKPLFNKLWPLSIGYQISQMSSIFLKNDLATSMQQNGFLKPMKMKSYRSANFEQYQNNSLFLGTHSSNNASVISKYFDQYKFDNQIITDYLAPALKNSHTYLMQKLNSTITNRTLSLSLSDFASINSQFQTSAKKFMSMAQDDTFINILFNIFSDSGKTVVIHDNSIDKYNANVIFNLWLNYHLTNAEAKLIMQDNILYYDFSYSDNSNNLRSLNNSYSNNTLGLISGVYNKSWTTVELYSPWLNINKLVFNLINSYNDYHDYRNGDNPKKLSLNDNLPISTYDHYFKSVTFKNYANPYILSGAYLGISIVSIPLTYWLFKRSDFN